ncbi:MAG: SWIM zinc finger family protein [Thermotogota bacterium]
MSYFEYGEYVSVSEKKAMADASIEKLKKKHPDIQPVIIEGRALAKSWWGKAWNQNLESYADYTNRIKRGRNYVRNHAVVDLKIAQGKVTGMVQGSRKKPYKIQIDIDPLSDERWTCIGKLCNNRIESVEKLIQGKFPEELNETFTDRQYGLFPSPKEIHFKCSCPDWAYMCKHIAAVLYGIGSRLDNDPLLFFLLRGVDVKLLIKKTMDEKVNTMLKNTNKKSSREINSDKIQDIFGL